MNFGFARRLVEDEFYQDLCRDLEHQTRKRKINRERHEVVKAVNQLPTRVPDGWRDLVSQTMLDRAHEMASLIESHMHGRWLRYDYNPRVSILHGSYGSRQ